MSFFGGPVNQARKPFSEILPDGRKRLTRWIKPTTTGTLPVELGGSGYTAGTVDPWPSGETPTGWDGLRLTYIQMDDDAKGFPQDLADHHPLIRLIYEQIDSTAETQVGDPDITFDQDGNINVEFNYVQFSAGTAVDLVVGTQTAPSPYTAAILKEQIATDDGTLRRIKRIYNGDRTLSDVQNLRFGGKVIVRTIVAIGTIPPTPSGFTLVGPGVLHPDGREIYTYEFAAAAGSGGVPGTSGQISIEYRNSQGGTVNFNPASPASANGITQATITYVTPLSVTTNPISTPSGFVLVGIEQKDDTGYKMWVGHYERGDGMVVDEALIQIKDALVIYHRVEYDAAPATPSATIGGTVTLFDTNVSQGDGWVRYDYRWAEGDGQSSITTQGQSDGALDYNVVTLTAAAATPSYPGSGTGYLISLNQEPRNGYFQNTAVYRKPPATQTFKKNHGFYMPGVAYFNIGPDEFIQQPPVNMTLLASYEVSYDVTQISDVPFTVEAWGYVTGYFKPTDGGIKTLGEGLGGYLAQASGVNSSTAATFNSIPCDEYDVQLISSIPSTFPGGTLVIDTDNDPYLVDTSGVVVFRRTKVSYAF
jgi:hypothetical protein